MPQKSKRPKKRSQRVTTHNRDLEDLALVIGVLCHAEGDGLKYFDQDKRRLNEAVQPQSLRDTVRSLDICLLPHAPVFVGGGGVVFQCADYRLPSIKYALKIPRPSLFDDPTLSGREKHRAEIDEFLKHAPLSHEHIARVLQTGKVTIPSRDGTKIEHDVILMEWIDGAQPLVKYLIGSTPRHGQVVNLLIDAFEALGYLHDSGLVHWDVKSDNILVGSAGTLKLTDIGNARRLADDGRKMIAYSTWGNTPPALDPYITYDPETGHGSRRVQISLPSPMWDSAYVDLWMLALELNRLFDAYPPPHQRDQDLDILPDQWDRQRAHFLRLAFPEKDDEARYSLGYLRRMLKRLLAPTTPVSPAYYRTGHHVAAHLRKLHTEFGGAQGIPELQAIPQKVLRLPQSGNLAWTPRFRRLFNEPIIRRLRKHRQLGTIVQVYPGAIHTRLEHSAGVVARTATFIRALYADRTEPFWRSDIEEQDVTALLLAAFLHDCGHIAYGHFIEEMVGLAKGRTHEDYALLVLDPTRDHSEHIQFGDATRRQALQDRHLLKAAILEDWGLEESQIDTFLRHVAMILRPTSGTAAVTTRGAILDPTHSIELKMDILHSVLDSAIDADKLDYLLRDAHHCGVHYAQGIDVDRFFQSLTTVPHLPRIPPVRHPDATPPVPRASIGITAKGILPVESALVARYQMFSCVYWHHTTRAHTAMLQYLVLSYLDGHTGRDSFDHLLDELVDQFRSSTDEEAIEWLKGQLIDSNKDHSPRQSLLRAMADGVLGRGREHLFRRACELRYDRAPDATARKLVDGLNAILARANATDDPTQYLHYLKTLRSHFAGRLERELGLDFAIQDGEVLIDIPPAGKDQVENIYVVDRDGFSPIQDLSSVADAVADAFRYWVRKPRVYFAPQLLERLGHRADRAAVWSACWTALVDLTQVQLDLFSRSGSPSP